MQLLKDVSSIAGGNNAACETNHKEMIDETERMFDGHMVVLTYGGPFYEDPCSRHGKYRYGLVFPEPECECTCKCKSIGPCSCTCKCVPVKPNYSNEF